MTAQPYAQSQKLLIPIDGSPSSEAALGHAIQLSRVMRVAVQLLNVQSAVMAGDVTVFTSAKSVEDRRRIAGERVLKRARDILAANRIDCKSEIAFGSPVAEIARSAAVNGCTKIVMATQGRGLLSRLFRPSVAQGVVKLARIPVTVVKADSLTAARSTHAREGIEGSGPPLWHSLCTTRKRSYAGVRAYRSC